MVKNILFVCTENSARSQMAEAFFNHYNKNPEYAGVSAGTKPASEIKELAIQVMKEKGIGMEGQKPKMLDLDSAFGAYRVYTMGCIKGCPITPPEKTEDWKLEDPAGKLIEKFREVRDEIDAKVKELVKELSVK